MKLSVSLPQGDVEFLDALVEEAAADSRSAALHHALHQAIGSLKASRCHCGERQPGQAAVLGRR